MKMTTVWRALGPIDMKSVGRDPLLRWLLLAPLLLALALRWLFPPLLTRIGEFLGVALLPYYDPAREHPLWRIGHGGQCIAPRRSRDPA